MIWTLLTGFLVMFMSAGFALVETGFTRAKNAVHTFSMNLREPMMLSVDHAVDSANGPMNIS